MSIDPTAEVHPTAIVEAGAEIGAGSRIGPYCVIGPDVRLAEGVVLHSHVVVAGVTQVGKASQIWPFASIGHQPQDLKFQGERTELVIGAGNMIREHVTMNPGTSGGGGVTRVGDNGLFMMGAHIGHDAMVGDGVIMANNATLAGHVSIGDGAILGGLSAAHQFCRIGRGAMIGGVSGVEKDVIPFGMAFGDRANLQGLNLVGLKRMGIDRAQMREVRDAYAKLFQKDFPLSEQAKAVMEEYGHNPLVAEIVEFISSASNRSFCTPLDT